MPKDVAAAYAWWSLAAEQGLEDGKKNRDIAAGRMTAAQLAEGRRLASEWRVKK